MIIRFWYCDAISLMIHLFRYFSVLCSFIVEHMHANRWKLIPHKPRFLQCVVFVLIRETILQSSSVYTNRSELNELLLLVRELEIRVSCSRVQKIPRDSLQWLFYQVRLESVISIKTMSSWNYYALLRLNPRKCKLIETVKSQDPFLSTTAKIQFKFILILKLSRR